MMVWVLSILGVLMIVAVILEILSYDPDCTCYPLIIEPGDEIPCDHCRKLAAAA